MNDLDLVLDYLVNIMSRFVRVLSFSFVGQIILGAFMFSFIVGLILSFFKHATKK